MFIDSASYTCAGGHDINEDSLLCQAEKGIFVVADGLGGHSDGEKASQAAISYFEENTSGGYTGEKLSALLEGANAEVLKNGDGGKTTVASAFMENGEFIYANVGDSRVYYFRGGKIIAQTKDHSVCQASVDMGMIRPEDIRGNEDRSRLLKVLGGDETLNIKKSYPPIRIQSGDAFLICSDGFWEYVYETEMEADLLKSDSAEVWLRHMLKRHILRAENKGDNYTAVCGIIHLDGSENFAPAAAAPEQKSLIPVMNKRNIIILAAAVAVIAAVVVFLCLFLGSGSGGAPADDKTETGAESSTHAATEETETVPAGEWQTPIFTSGSTATATPEGTSPADTYESGNTVSAPEGGNTADTPENTTSAGTTTAVSTAVTTTGGSSAGTTTGGSSSGTPAGGNPAGTAAGGSTAGTPASGTPIDTPEEITPADTTDNSTTADTPEEVYPPAPETAEALHTAQSGNDAASADALSGEDSLPIEI